MEPTPNNQPNPSPEDNTFPADWLLDQLPWGVMVVDEQHVVRRINQQAAQWCGAEPAAVLHQPLAQAALPPGIQMALQQVVQLGELAPQEVWLPHSQQWVTIRREPAPDGQHWVFWEDVTARKQAEEAEQRSHELLLAVEGVAHTGSYEADLVTGSFYFSDGLYRLFGEAPQAFVPTLERIDARSHPDDAAAIRQILEAAVRTKQPYSYRRRIRRADGQPRTLEAHGEVYCDAAGTPTQLRGLVQDVTERVHAEQALRQSHELLQRTIDSSLDLVQVFEAVRDEQGAVVDFTWILNNDAAEQVYGNVIGQRLCALNPGVVAEGIFDTFRQVLETGVPDQSERHYVHEQFDGWFLQSTVKLGDGVTTTTHDITARKQAEQELRQTKELLQAVLDNSHFEVQAFRAVRNAEGRIVDFTWLLTNKSWSDSYGGDMTGKSLLQENPGVVETGLFDLFVQVTETGAPVDHEQYYAHEQFNGWFHQALVKLGDGFVMNTVDITERKQAQEEILGLKDELARRATDKYHALFNAIDEGFYRCEVLFDDANRPVDILYLEENPAAVRLTGQRFTGRRLRDISPLYGEHWYQIWGAVALTGVSQRFDEYSEADRLWLSIYVSRVGEATNREVAVVFQDITARKLVEEQLRLAAVAETFRLALADALGPLSDPMAIQETATRTARRHFGADRCYYGEIAHEQVFIRRDAATEGLPSVVGAYPLAEFPLLQAVLDAGRPFIVHDVRLDPSVDENLRQLCVQLQVISYVNVPVIKDGQAVGILSLVQSQPRDWTAAEAALAAEVAERTWAAVERAKAEAALATSEEKFRTLFESIDEGFCVQELVFDQEGQVVDLIYREANAAFERHTGLADANGKRASQVFPHIEPYWFDALTRVYQTGVIERTECYNTDTGRWLTSHYLRIGGAGSPFIAAVFNDITERQRREQEQAFLLQLSDVLRPLSDADEIETAACRLLGQWLDAHRVYYVEIVEAEGRARVGKQYLRPGVASIAGEYSLDAFNWTAPPLRRGEAVVVADVYRSDLVPPDYLAAMEAVEQRAIVLIPLVKNGTWMGVLTVGNDRPRDWQATEVALAREMLERTWAAAERARAETALRESEQRLQTLIANLPGAAVFIVDRALRYQLAEGEALRAAGYTPADFRSQPVRALAPPGLWPTYRRLYRQALAGQAFEHEHTQGGRTFLTRGVPLPRPSGAVEAVLAVSYDITARKQAEEALQASELKYRTLFETMDQGFGIGQVLPADEATGAPMDWQWLEVNPQFERLTGLPRAAVLSQTTRQLIPGLEEIWYERYAQAANGETVNFEAYSPVLERWFDVYAFALGPPDNRRVAVLFSNTSEQKHVEAALREAELRYREQLEQQVTERTRELQESRDLLQSMFDTNLIAMSVQEAVRDEAGAVQDFRLRLVSRELARETGRTDLEGKLYAQEYPGIREVGIFDLAVRALETGEPQGMEYYYPHEGFERWYSCQFVKLGDGVVATNLDITERKMAEQERLKNLRLLEQAEAVAGLGSWDYDVATDTMRWSEGMYHLFGLPVGSPVTPSHYLNAVLPDDRPRARQLVHRLTAGEDFEETLRLQVHGQVKTVRMKAVVLRNEASQPTRVLGVDLDISELQRLEADNLRLHLRQQHVLFEAVQAAQEEERKRMAESLHNGIGQILYATKLRLDRLHTPLLRTTPTLAAARQEADQLLAEAIRQTRALSHELVPMVLQDFGLAAALKDIGSKMSTPQLRISCQVVLDEEAAPLTPALQLALYRMAQELAQNIVKHARGATQASLEVETMPGWVLLRAEDNGSGFAPAAASSAGLGLRSIHDRVALLGGKLERGVVPTGGAYVRIRIPHPPLS